MKLVRLMLHPKPELVRLDTSLRFTDILFGFVIREIFLRLQYWQNLPRDVLMQLGVCSALVLGSWIGYRRSLNRSAYEVKFFNLPFFRFLLDQGMLVLYFQMAGFTPADLGKPGADPNTKVPLAPNSFELANGTVRSVFIVFILYSAWDLLGMFMAASKVSGKPRYPEVTGNVVCNKIVDDSKQQRPDWAAVVITVVFLGLFEVLRLLLNQSCTSPVWTFIICIVLLLAYRLVKEIKTSWRRG